MLAGDCCLGDGGGGALPFAHAIVLRVEAHGPGLFRVLDLYVLTPFVNGGDARDAHAAGTLARTGLCVEPGRTTKDSDS